jgi:hypothetical protein
MERGAQRRHTKRPRHSRTHAGLAELSPPFCGSLTGKVDALPGFEAVAEVALPPLVGLIEMTDLYLVGFRVLGKPVAKSEVAIETHEFPKINVGNTRVTSNDQHVLVIIGSRSLTKVCRTANYLWVGAQWIDQHVFRMQISHINV